MQKKKRAEIIRIENKDNLSMDRGIWRAAELLGEGMIGAVPTETVWALAAKATNKKAVEKIYEVKKRSKRNPLIVHCHNIKDAERWITEFNGDATTLAHTFWPGPLTMVLPKNPGIPDVTTAGLDTVAIRVPNHPIALALIKQLGEPFAAPSANESGLPSGTTMDAVMQDLGDKIDFIIHEEGKCKIGIESTIIDMTSKPTILRFGGLPLSKIKEEIGEVDIDPVALGETGNGQPKAPGMMFRHYAPKYAMVKAFSRNCERLPVLNSMVDGARELKEEGNEVILVFSSQILGSTCDQIKKYGIKRDHIIPFSDAVQLGQNLFHVYREFDRKKTFILVEEAKEPEDVAMAVNNRIRVSARKKK